MQLLGQAPVDGTQAVFPQLLAPPELVVKRYRRLVVGSGDGIFAARAQRARDLGVDVLVVARDGGCSGKLRSLAPRLLTDDLQLAA